MLSSASPLSSVCRTALLRHKTAAFALLESLALAPLQLVAASGSGGGSAAFDAGAETVRLELFRDWSDDVRRPCDEVELEVRHAGVDFGRAAIRVHAEFVGLRALMFYNPVAARYDGDNLDVVVHIVVIVAISAFWALVASAPWCSRRCTSSGGGCSSQGWKRVQIRHDPKSELNLEEKRIC